MKTCYVMVGLPATGKSTFIEKLKNNNTWIYSTDIYIESVAENNGITYDEAFKTNINDAKKFNDNKLETMTYLEKDIIWDQTNLGKKKRKKIINQMKEKGYRLECICFLHPDHCKFDDFKLWNERLMSREGKTIPQNVISNMIESFTLPTEDEGFDKITYYNIHGIEISGEFNWQ